MSQFDRGFGAGESSDASERVPDATEPPDDSDRGGFGAGGSSPASEPIPDLAEPPGEPGRKRIAGWIAGAIFLLVAGWAGYSWLSRPAPRPVGESTPAPEPAPVPVADTPPAPSLPALDDSDTLLRNLIRGLTGRPEAMAWLMTDEIARRIAIATDNVADGVSPRRALQLLAPSGDYRVRTTDAGLEVHPSSFARYDGIAAVIAEADMAAVAGALDRVMPLLEEAYAELGRTDRGFAEALLLALERLTAAPVPRSPILLREQTFRYEYTETVIENLDPASKHLVRFGPANQQRIQQALLSLAARLRSGGAAR